MGYLDAFGGNMLQKDSQGRLVWIHSRRRGKAFLVPPDRARALLRFVKVTFGLMMAAVLAAVFLWGFPATLIAIVGGPLVFRLGLSWFARGLEPATELPTATREEVFRNKTRAMGLGTIIAVSVIFGAQTIWGIQLLLGGARGFAPWFLTIYGATVAILYAWWWLKGRRLRQQPNEEL